MDNLPIVSKHAVKRYIERVDRGADDLGATLEIMLIAASARSRSNLRWWTQIAGQRPGTRYLYSATSPGVCLVRRENTIVTVFSRGTCHQWRHTQRLERHVGVDPKVRERLAALQEREELQWS